MGVFSLNGGFPPIDFTPQVLIIFSRKNHGPVELRFFLAMKGVCQKGNSTRACVGKFVLFTASRRHA